MHKECKYSCFSKTGAAWEPSHIMPTEWPMVHQSVDYVYYMHLLEAEIQGHFWKINGCMQFDKVAKCATDLLIYAVAKA